LAFIERERVNIFFAFPDVYLGMFDVGLDDYDLSSVNIWIGTADTSHEIHMAAFCQKGVLFQLFGKPIIRSIFIEPLGTSEVGFAALTRFHFPFSRLTFNRRLGWPSVAAPKIKVADENGRRLPSGKVGRLMVKGKTLFKGYWNEHDRLHGVMFDGWWWTGDIVYQDRLRRIHHLDRATDLIYSRDGLISTLLTEEVLISHPDVSEVAVFGIPHPQKGMVPVAVICPKPNRTLDLQSYRKWTEANLNLLTELAEIFIVPCSEIPRGVTGKVLKRTLRERYKDWFTESSASSVEPDENLLGLNGYGREFSHRNYLKK
jgi:acyl-coenzyme A synthetase/AMP-(fatty) acid ligase